jgi:hypothetical protein
LGLHIELLVLVDACSLVWLGSFALTALFGLGGARFLPLRYQILEHDTS